MSDALDGLVKEDVVNFSFSFSSFSFFSDFYWSMNCCLLGLPFFCPGQR